MTASENLGLMKGTVHTFNFMALSSITHVNAFTVNFRIHHLFVSKVTLVFYLIFFPPAIADWLSIMLLRVRQMELFNRMCERITNSAVLFSSIYNRSCLELGS